MMPWIFTSIELCEGIISSYTSLVRSLSLLMASDTCDFLATNACKTEISASILLNREHSAGELEATTTTGGTTRVGETWAP